MISNHELCQFLKLPFLVQHYYQHREENKELGFIEFIENHYSEDVATHQDNQKHQHLPFKCHDDCIGISAPAIIGSSFCVFITAPLNEYQTYFPVQGQIIITSSYLSSIWQPPRIS